MFQLLIVRAVVETVQVLAVMGHVAALELACMVPDPAALVDCKDQPAVSTPVPALASNRAASTSAARRLRAGRQATAAAMPGRPRESAALPGCPVFSA